MRYLVDTHVFLGFVLKAKLYVGIKRARYLP